jgi:hypothetical protein
MAGKNDREVGLFRRKLPKYKRWRKVLATT